MDRGIPKDEIVRKVEKAITEVKQKCTFAN